ncbi:protein YAE1 homolog [Thamnophis elegans]|uniref:protein YAE1 homolog n=1 Tax=Thamnophis elegans TaxID=35005 RepID=UPI0013774793|nr:protein YAE1 homolog [Thamnophis elegans]XP_032090394.1 protein YAE1 homolog [Thamnophis elegans]
MSWLQPAVSQCGEDVFDENADEMDIAQKEWKSEMEKRIKEGYRDGVEAGKVVTLQQGFNQGYKEAIRVIFACSQLKGTISALLSWYHHNKHSPAMLNKMTDLLNQLRVYEEHVLNHLNRVNPQPSVGDLLHTLNDMDLDRECCAVEQHNRTCAELTKNSCTNNGTDSFQNEYCGRTEGHIGSKRATLSWLKERTASIMEQFGLSPDTVKHI